MARVIGLLAVFAIVVWGAVTVLGAGERVAAQDAAGILLFPGGNYVTYLGESRPLEEALTVPRGEITAVFRFDGPTQRWQAWERGGPARLQGVVELVSRLAYWVNYEGAGDVFWAFQGEASPPDSIGLTGGWNSFGYAGDGGPIEGFLAIAGIDTDIVFRWDATKQRWESWSSRLPEALIPFSDFEPGTAYFFQGSRIQEWTFARLTALDLAILAIADGAIFPAADRVPEALMPPGARVARIGFAGGVQRQAGGDIPWNGARVRLIVPLKLDQALTFYRDALSQLSGGGEVTQEGENFLET